MFLVAIVISIGLFINSIELSSLLIAFCGKFLYSINSTIILSAISMCLLKLFFPLIYFFLTVLFFLIFWYGMYTLRDKVTTLRDEDKGTYLVLVVLSLVSLLGEFL